jgi:alkylhydroperoxidase/carboxymuconolactone decarboxylase family protein YurZ
MPIPERLETLLRYLTISEETTLDRLFGGQIASELDRKTTTLAVVSALVGAEADGASYQAAIDAARAAGANDGEIVDTVVTIAPLVGAVRLEAAIPALIIALGDGAEPV